MGVIFCENCGTQIPDDSKFCESCGATITVPPAAPPPAYPVVPQPPPARTPGSGNAIPKAAIIGVAAVVIIAIIAAVLLIPPASPPTPPYTVYRPNTTTPTTVSVTYQGMTVQQLYDKGIELKDQQKYSEAIAYFDQVIAKEPSHQDAWSYKAYCYLQLETNENVLTSADKALSLDPQDKWTWTNKGLALDNLGRYSEAITCYDKAIAIDANYKYPWNNKGWALEQLGRYSEAIRCYEKALEIDPNYSTSQNNLNRIKTKMATSAPPTTTRPASTEDLILDVWTLNAVKNNPSYLPKLSLSRTVTVTKVLTYHWNDGKGATPGSITILDNDQKAVGTWKAKGEPGMYDVPNANWVATPNIDLQAGTYYIKDTSPSTWSWNENTNGQGMTKVWGIKK